MTHCKKGIRLSIGIDPGVNTGLAIWDREIKAFIAVRSLPIHGAMAVIMDQVGLFGKDSIIVRVEDARKRTWFANAGREQLQGAGSIKRDCKIWEDFLTEKGVAFEMIAPKQNKTKVTHEYFQRLTGWQTKTNSHSRDAAMLVLNY